MDAKARTRLQTTLEAARLIQDWTLEQPYEDAASDLKLKSAYLWQFVRVGGTLRLARDVDSQVDQLVRVTDAWIALGHHVVRDYREPQEERIRVAITDGIPALIHDLEALSLD